MGLYDDITREPISVLPLRELNAVQPDSSCRDAVALMRKKRLGFVLILDDQGRPAGMFTERQLIRLLLDDPKGLDEPVGSHMSKESRTLKHDAPIAKLIEKLQSLEWRFVCVVDGQGKAVGVTGQRGLMEYIADHFPRQVKVQEMDSKLYMDQREGA